jgi:hypothetical protein
MGRTRTILRRAPNRELGPKARSRQRDRNRCLSGGATVSGRSSRNGHLLLTRGTHRRSHGAHLDDDDWRRRWSRRAADRRQDLRSARSQAGVKSTCTNNGGGNHRTARCLYPTLGRSRSRSRARTTRSSPEPRRPATGRETLSSQRRRPELGRTHLMPRRREEVPQRDRRRARSRGTKHFRRPRPNLRQILLVGALIRQRPEPRAPHRPALGEWGARRRRSAGGFHRPERQRPCVAERVA